MNASPAEFRKYVEGRGYHVEALLNTGEAAQSGVPLRTVGYTLFGPRGNRCTVGLDREGNLPIFSAQLWCDGVDYATNRLAKKRA